MTSSPHQGTSARCRGRPSPRCSPTRPALADPWRPPGTAAGSARGTRRSKSTSHLRSSRFEDPVLGWLESFVVQFSLRLYDLSWISFKVFRFVGSVFIHLSVQDKFGDFAHYCRSGSVRDCCSRLRTEGLFKNSPEARTTSASNVNVSNFGSNLRKFQKNVMHFGQEKKQTYFTEKKQLVLLPRFKIAIKCYLKINQHNPGVEIHPEYSRIVIHKSQHFVFSLSLFYLSIGRSKLLSARVAQKITKCNELNLQVGPLQRSFVKFVTSKTFKISPPNIVL